METSIILGIWAFWGLAFRLIFFIVASTNVSTTNLTITTSPMAQVVPNVYKRILVGILSGPLWWGLFLIGRGMGKFFSWVARP